MDSIINTYRIYVKTDSDENITAVNSSAFLTDTTGWMQTDEGSGDKYVHAQGNYFDKPLTDANGCYNYKLVYGKPVERTAEEKQSDTAYVEQIRDKKLVEISTACEQTIYAGVDVADSKGTEHFSLTMADQTNISALAVEVKNGAAAVPYHADGQLCREFAADEFIKVFTAVKDFVTYNTTLCNHINVWIKRCTTAQEISAITYSSTLPDDLQDNFNAILGGAV